MFHLILGYTIKIATFVEKLPQRKMSKREQTIIVFQGNGLLSYIS